MGGYTLPVIGASNFERERGSAPGFPGRIGGALTAIRGTVCVHGSVETDMYPLTDAQLPLNGSFKSIWSEIGSTRLGWYWGVASTPSHISNRLACGMLSYLNLALHVVLL